MRKSRILAVAAVSAMSLITACSSGSSSGQDKKSLTLVSFGAGAYQDAQVSAWVKPFETATGSKITIDSPSSNAKIKAMVEAGKVSWDVVATDGYFPRANCGKYVEKIDVGLPSSDFPHDTLTPCGVPVDFYALEFMYNSKAYHTNPPTSLADFFDPKKYPGKRVVLGDPTAGLLEAALLGDGVNQSRLYPLDIKRALSVYNRIKPDLTISPTNGAEQQAMVGNQADMALVVSSRAYTVLKAGGTFWRPVWDKLPVGWDTLVIPKGSPHSDLATQFIKFASQPVQSADFASAAGLGAANTSAAVKLNPLQQEVDAFSAAHKPNLVYLDGEWWSANLDKVVTAWTNWTTG